MLDNIKNIIKLLVENSHFHFERILGDYGKSSIKRSQI